MVRLRKSPPFGSPTAHLVVRALGYSDCRIPFDDRLVRIRRRSTKIWCADLLAPSHEQCRRLHDCLRCNTDRLPALVIHSVWTHLRSCWLSAAHAYQNWDFPKAAQLDAKMVSTCLSWLRYFLDTDLLHHDLHGLSKSR